MNDAVAHPVVISLTLDLVAPDDLDVRQPHAGGHLILVDLFPVDVNGEPDLAELVVRGHVEEALVGLGEPAELELGRQSLGDGIQPGVLIGIWAYIGTGH